MNRRTFVSQTASGVIAAAVAGQARGKELANNRVSVAVVGVRGRGNALLSAFASLPTVDVKYIVDLDPQVLAQRIDEVYKRVGRKPEGLSDFRRALDDHQLDALVLGTPDHWHALPTIMACQARKDVYVEKPDGHNVRESMTMVAAAKKHGRVVQLGTQFRSSDRFQSAAKYLQEGHLGRVVCAKAWESSRQRNLGNPPDGTPPPGVDYDFWLGPAPKRPFNPLRFHGNFRWFFDYGTGDLGNDGVHRLDMARWMLDTASVADGRSPLPTYPERIAAVGGKFYFDDAQEWPDTLAVHYDFGDRMLSYEMRIWSAYRSDDESEGAAVYGDEGYLIMGNSRWRAFDAKGKLIVETAGGDNTSGHAQNFIDCMRSRGKPAADLETVGHPSSMLCHLGNAAWRAGRSLRFDAASRTFGDDAQANRLLSRPEYRAPWLLPKIEDV